MPETKELKYRVEAKKKQLEARLAELQADAHARSSDEEKRVRLKLAELEHDLESGWHNLSDRSADKLSEWLKKA